MQIHNIARDVIRNMIEDSYLSIFNLIKLYEIDTGVTHYANRNVSTIFFGKGDNKKRYVIDKEKTHKKTILYHSKYAEPITIDGIHKNFKELKPINLKLDLENTPYAIDTKEFDTIYTNKLIKQMYASNQVNDIKIILYIVAGHAVFNIAVHYGYIQ